ncbi:MOSC domain-containing protein [Amycolatopsis nigrescens]|uniref:MOSC domain-containing protein n=1 Tax=Amycolatopsis nigrescens TaxID=381445 RepID=UPI0003785815|nr:MOSC domain-containing protein [Amycolatopsis nigrescens]
MSVEGVFVGRPSVLGTQRGEPVYSAITKHRVDAAELRLTELNLDGDDQADRTVHGGPDKAVYAYPAEHYRDWAADSFELAPGAVGENVSCTGADERTVRIGDVWQWGDALVSVSQPRSPCFKLAMKAGRKDVVPAMIDSGRSGWYLRVLRPGLVPTSGPMVLAERDLACPTVAEVYLVSFANGAKLDDAQRAAFRELAERVTGAPGLAERYRQGLLKKLAKLVDSGR